MFECFSYPAPAQQGEDLGKPQKARRTQRLKRFRLWDMGRGMCDARKDSGCLGKGELSGLVSLNVRNAQYNPLLTGQVG
jgi:hypothetical protein